MHCFICSPEQALCTYLNLGFATRSESERKIGHIFARLVESWQKTYGIGGISCTEASSIDSAIGIS